MGRLIIIENSSDIPDPMDDKEWRSLCRAFVTIKETFGVDETNTQWFQAELRLGQQLATGARIIAAIESCPEDILLIPIVSQTHLSQFEPDVPAVVLNCADIVLKNNFIPGDDPQQMHHRVLLFHELGHAAQWATRREWFQGSAQRSKAAKEPYHREIEQDNLTRHEVPFSQEMGLPYRRRYEDLCKDAESASARWAEIKIEAATVIQRAWRDHRAKAVPAK
ncbi:MAG: hypothetical protein O2816_12080 [Planctomycetota bacterium]|nr:hypothetical protein [Planctomycetota bacterium]